MFSEIHIHEVISLWPVSIAAGTVKLLNKICIVKPVGNKWITTK